MILTLTFRFFFYLPRIRIAARPLISLLLSIQVWLFVENVSHGFACVLCNCCCIACCSARAHSRVQKRDNSNAVFNILQSLSTAVQTRGIRLSHTRHLECINTNQIRFHWVMCSHNRQLLWFCHVRYLSILIAYCRVRQNVRTRCEPIYIYSGSKHSIFRLSGKFMLCTQRTSTSINRTVILRPETRDPRNNSIEGRHLTREYRKHFEYD